MSSAIEIRPGFTEALERAYAAQSAFLARFVVDGQRLHDSETGQIAYEGPCAGEVLRKASLRAAIATLMSPTGAMVDSWFDYIHKSNEGIVPQDDSSNIVPIISAILAGVIGEGPP
jgi:hypothetical protein